MKVIEITPHPDSHSDYCSLLLRYPDQLDTVTHYVDQALEDFDSLDDGEDKDDFKLTIEIKSKPLQEVFDELHEPDDHWIAEMRKAYQAGEPCIGWEGNV